ncbi:tail fiber domain-containing protein [Agrobacterium tumefaciens]|nr:tail fiber domain-containing protein [Agrobacterium tumefaciens]
MNPPFIHSLLLKYKVSRHFSLFVFVCLSSGLISTFSHAETVQGSYGVSTTGYLEAVSATGPWIATQSEAEDGANNDQLMTPLRVKQALISALGTGNFSGDRIVSGTASLTVDTAGTVTQRSSGNSKLALQGDGSNFIELGNTRTTNNYAYIDLIGDATYTDYGLRLIRDNAGPNANSWLQHRGTGGLHLMTQEAAPIVFRTSNTEQMRVLPNGNVGIGTSLPQAPMEVAGITTARAIAQGSVGLGHISETGWDGNGIIFTNSYITSSVTHRSIVQNGGNLYFGRHSSSGHTTDMFIAESGRVGIGTSSPRTSLDSPRGAVFNEVSVGACPFGSCVGDNIDYSYEAIQLPGGTNLRLFFGSNQRFIFGNDGTPYKPNGGSWAAISDKRLKQVEGSYTRGLKQIAGLNPVRYHYTKNNPLQQPSDKEYVGLLAQDVQPHFPEAVHKAEDGYYRLDTTSINFAMINAVKELKSENDDLKTEMRRFRQDFEDYKHRHSQVVQVK